MRLGTGIRDVTHRQTRFEARRLLRGGCSAYYRYNHAAHPPNPKPAPSPSEQCEEQEQPVERGTARGTARATADSHPGRATAHYRPSNLRY
jgi:hypothetical protein